MKIDTIAVDNAAPRLQHKLPKVEQIHEDVTIIGARVGVASLEYLLNGKLSVSVRETGLPRPKDMIDIMTIVSVHQAKAMPAAQLIASVAPERRDMLRKVLAEYDSGQVEKKNVVVSDQALFDSYRAELAAALS